MVLNLLARNKTTIKNMTVYKIQRYIVLKKTVNNFYWLKRVPQNPTKDRLN